MDYDSIIETYRYLNYFWHISLRVKIGNFARLFSIFSLRLMIFTLNCCTSTKINIYFNYNLTLNSIKKLFSIIYLDFFSRFHSRWIFFYNNEEEVVSHTDSTCMFCSNIGERMRLIRLFSSTSGDFFFFLCVQ